MQTSAQAGDTVQPEAKQKVVAKKNAFPPLKRRKIHVLNVEEVDNTLVECLESSPMRIAAPSKMKITYLADISSDEEKEESESEYDLLSPQLGSVAIKPNAKAAATLTSKGYVQT